MTKSSFKDLIEKYYYDPWDKYKYIFEEKIKANENTEKILEFMKNMGKIFITINSPKSEKEFAISCSYLLLFTRPLEIFFGSKLILYTYLFSHLFTFFCFLPLPQNAIRNNIDANPYAYCFSMTTAILFSFTGATKSFILVSKLSFLALLYYLYISFNENYETRPIFMAAIIMSLYMNYKLRVH
jgi:hypothetical protein